MGSMGHKDGDRSDRKKKNLKEIQHVWKKIAVVLSIFVVIGIGYGLSRPAVTMSNLVCPLEEHIHVDSCYGEDGTTLICGMEEHTHNENCYETVVEEEPEPEPQPEPEQIQQEESPAEPEVSYEEEDDSIDPAVVAQNQANVKMWFDKLTVRERVNAKEEWADVDIEHGAEIDRADELEIILHDYELDGYMLTESLNKITYHLPDSLIFREEVRGDVTIGDKDHKEVIGNYLIKKDGTMEISFRSDLVQKNEDGELIKGDITFETVLDQTKIKADRSIELKFEEDLKEILYVKEEVQPTEKVPVVESKTTKKSIKKSVRRKAPTNANPIDFTQWIEKATLIVNGNEIPAGQSVSENDNLQFKIDYKIPSGTLQTSTDLVYPVNGLSVQNVTSGNIYGEDSSIHGTYEIKDGKIYLHFTNDNIVKLNERTPVEGYVKFYGKVLSDNISDNGQSTIKFNDKVSLNVGFNDHIISSKNDLTVEKTQGTIDRSNGTVVYTVKVKSQNGTGSGVTLNDVMNQIGLLGEVTVQGPGQANVIKNGSNFSVQIPQMGAGQEYTLTYTAKLTNTMLNGKVDASNKVTAKTTRQTDGAQIKDEVEVKTTFTQDLIKKTGENRSDGIHWTVVVNSSRRDIGGWKLTDLLNGNNYTGNATVSPALNGSTAVNFENGVVFPQGDHNMYTFTYTTPKRTDRPIGKSETTNEAKLTADPDDGGDTVTTGSIGGGDIVDYQPLAKQGGQVKPSADKTTANVGWTATIDATQYAIPGGWVYKDSYVDGRPQQWFTADQLKGLKQSLDQAISKLNISLSYTLEAREDKYNGNFVPVESLDGQKQYKLYQITFHNELPQGKKLVFSYESTVPFTGVVDRTTFYNQASINNVVVQGEATYEPPKVDKPTVVKMDATNNMEDKTEHEFTEDQNKELSWMIKVLLPDNYQGGDLKVKEILPEGVSLSQINFSGETSAENKYKYYGVDLHEGENKIYYDGGPYNVKEEKKGNDVIITIPQSLYTLDDLNNIILNVKVKIESTDSWPSGSTVNSKIKEKDLTNKVELFNEKDGKIDESEQTQGITVKPKKESSDVSEGEKLSKSAGDVKSGAIPYTLTINPEGKDLNPDSDTLDLEDVFSYNVNFIGSLVPGSVHVYKRQGDGKEGEELDFSEYKQSYEETKTVNQNEGKTYYKHIMKFVLPDETPLIIKYIYRMQGTSGQWVNAQNTATLSGESEKIEEKENHSNVQVNDSEAGAGANGITIYKVDSNNNAHMLPGAEFELYKWNSTNNRYEIVPDDENQTTRETGMSGTLVIGGVEYNTAYYLQETKAPENYKLNNTPYYFYVGNKDTVTHPAHMPEGFTGENYKMGGGIYIENEETASLTIVKKWQDADGNPKVRTSGNIEVEIQQRVKGEENWKEYKRIKIAPDSGMSWTCTEEGLPKKDVSGNEYEYRVKELDSDGFIVSYDNNEGIQSGIITITNKEEETYDLPETGGPGTQMYIFSGFAMMLFASALLYKKKCRNGRGRAST